MKKAIATLLILTCPLLAVEKITMKARMFQQSVYPLR
jgi:hypothetical protein